jgi:uncharacterized protein (DUF983 family)
MDDPLPPLAFARAAVFGRCPRCGQGRIFCGMLTLCERCPVCGLDLTRHDVGDGAAFAAIFILGPIIVIAALIVEFTYSPPLWLHILLWPVVTVVLAVLFMRPSKSILLALQYRYRQSGSSP